MADTKHEKVWVQNIKGMLRGVQFTGEMRAACLREFEAFLSAAEKREREARAKALEESAQVAERDVDWSAFGKRDIQPWENGNDSVRDYRLGIATGRAIAASIRALQSEER